MTASEMNQQLVISGLGGQGILFLSRLMAEAATAAGRPVFVSETHGMAQRGGVVISHLKVGEFSSPLVRPGRADGVVALREENLPLHLRFVRPGGFVVVNARQIPRGLEDYRVFALDADRIALEAESPRSVNLIMLGFALSVPGLVFCTRDDVVRVMEEGSEKAGKGLQRGLDALDAGFAAGLVTLPKGDE